MTIVREEELSALAKELFPDLTDIPLTLPMTSMGILDEERRIILGDAVARRWDVPVEALPAPTGDDTIVGWVHAINAALGLSDMTVRDMFLDICHRHLNEIALRFDDEVVTYDDLHAAVMTLAEGLQRLDVHAGDRVALLMENRLEYIYSYFALFVLGALPVPLNSRWQEREIRNVLEDCGAMGMIFQERGAGRSYLEMVQNLVAEGLPLTACIVIADEVPAPFVRYTDATKNAGEPRLEPIAGEDAAMISYTSGTTGSPKGVVTRNRDIVTISLSTCYTFAASGLEALSIAPLYSAQGFIGLFENFARECGFHMLSTFNPNDILRQVSTGQEQCIHTQPTMWSLMLHSREMDFARFEGLERLVVSGSVCSPELARQIENRLGCELLNAYGLVESCSIATMTRIGDPEDVRLRTVGRPVPGVEIKIVDADRREIPRGASATGELAVRGFVMKGYYGKPDKTAEVVDDDGWLYTGDLARWHDEENISIVGRCKDMVIRGGFNVYPSDIEEQLLQLPGVQTAAVVGIPHDILGEKLVAFVVPLPGEEMTSGTLARAMRPRIADYKQPDEYHVVAQVPIILAGKVDKKALVDWAINGIPGDQQVVFGWAKGAAL
ncbi:hypothetical protein HMPREF1531_00705 [Propionibacterium sp. oral taxon 192 str. F0372]|uniref:class I adenylate-forming enzyme family protein n=1 Tax=Propionibacterium sp. oral taxon 192 TaxID=671222 RepID=UPI0003532291|nr:class I adenylate-forming enzyme family protein [Propionibacterium sp. oral taxon 192]EPH06057.1 hypothetical protein HMPREF1531_00705 [Propionibacterium sp. oral taxon 192 str. F0372]